MSANASPLPMADGLLSCTEANDSLNSIEWSTCEAEEFKSPRSILNNVNSLAISPISNSGATASQMSQKGELDFTSSSVTPSQETLTPRHSRKQIKPMRFKVRLFSASTSETQENCEALEVTPLSPEDSRRDSTRDGDPFLNVAQEDLTESMFHVLDDGHCSSPVASQSTKSSVTNHDEVLTAMQCIIDYLDGEYPLQYTGSVQSGDNAQNSELLDYCLSNEGIEDLKDSVGKSKPIVFTRADNWIAACRESPPRHQRPPMHMSGSISDPAHLRYPALRTTDTEANIKAEVTEKRRGSKSSGNSVSKDPPRKSSRAQRLHFSPDYDYGEIRFSHGAKRTTPSPPPEDGKENFHFSCSNRIKRPRNAFILYTIEHRAAMARLYPNTDNREISKLLGEHWKSLSERDKMPYRQAANKEMAELRYRYPNWKYSGTRTQDPLSNGTGGCRQKRRRYNKKTPSKPVELREQYMSELFSTVNSDAMDEEWDFKPTVCEENFTEDSLSGPGTPTVSSQQTEPYSWRQCEKCRRWRRLSLTDDELDAGCCPLRMESDCMYSPVYSPEAYGRQVSANSSD